MILRRVLSHGGKDSFDWQSNFYVPIETIGADVLPSLLVLVIQPSLIPLILTVLALKFCLYIESLIFKDLRNGDKAQHSAISWTFSNLSPSCEYKLCWSNNISALNSSWYRYIWRAPLWVKCTSVLISLASIPYCYHRVFCNAPLALRRVQEETI